MIWVLSGRIRLAAFEPDGAETVLAILEAGECFGLGRDADGVVGGTAEALEDADVVGLSAAVIGADDELLRLLRAAEVPV